MHLQKDLLAPLALWTTLLAPGVALAQAKIAVVDSARASAQCEAGLAAQATMTKLYDARRREVDMKQAQIQQERAALDKELQSGKLSPAATQKKVEAWQAKAKKLSDELVEQEKEFMKRQAQLFQPINESVDQAVARLAQAGGIALVVERSAARYLEPGLDLTDQVIAAVNASAKK